MIVFPLLSSMIATLCAAVMVRDAWHKPRPDKIVWSIAFTLFAVAAGIEVVGSGSGWTELLARTYYATGVALVVVFLAAGQMFLLFPGPMKRFGFAVTLLITALWISMVFNAPIDQARIAADGWDAIERGPELQTLGIALNAIGTLIIVGGSGWAVVRFWKTGTQRHRMFGCLLILVGTLVVASGGSLERLGSDEFLYIAMAIGVAIIFAGVLTARTPDGVAASRSAEPDVRVGVAAEEADLKVALGAAVPAGHAGLILVASPAPAEAVAFIEHLLMSTDQDVESACAEWSIARDPATVLTRSEARRAWQLRGRLTADGLVRFDRHTVPARRQLTGLYFEVLAWERPARDEIAELVSPPEGVGLLRRGEQGEGR